MATTIDKLQIEISSSADKAVKGLNELAVALGELKDKGKLTTLTNNLNKLSEALKGFKGITTYATNIMKISEALEKIDGNKDFGTLARTLNSLSKAVTSLKDAGDGLKNMKNIPKSMEGLDSSKDFSKLASSLGKLGDSLRGFKDVNEGLKSLKKADNALNKFKSEGNSLNEIARGVNALKKSMKDIGDIGEAVKSLDLLREALNGLARIDKMKGLNSADTSLKNMAETIKVVNKANISAFKNRVQELASALQGLQSLGVATGLKDAVRQLNKIPELATALNAADFGTFKTQMQTLAASLQPLASIEKASGVTSILNALKKVPELAAALNVTDFGTFKTQMQGLALALQSLQGVEIISGLNSLMNALKKVPEVATGLSAVDFGNFNSRILELVSALQFLQEIEKSAGLTSAVNSLKKIPDIAKGLDNVDFSSFASKIKELAAALQPLATEVERAAGFTTTVNALRRIPEITKSLDSETIKKFAERVNELAKEIAPAVRQLRGLGDAIHSMNLFLRQGSSNMKDFSKQTKTSSMELNASIELIMKAVSAVNMLVQKFKEPINTALNMDGIIQRIGVTFGKSAKGINEELDKMTEAFSLNKQQLLQYTGIFGSLLTGFGVSADKVSAMSVGLTQATYDLWSATNDLYPNIESTALALKSAITGEIEAIRNYGISISKATLKQTALNHGIKMSVDNMTESQKSILRYVAIVEAMDKKGVIGNYAREMNTAEGAVRMLKQQLRILAQEIGSVFIPMIMAVIPYVTAFVQLIGKGVQALAKLLGIDYSKLDWSKFSNSTQDLSNNFKEANKEAKALKGTLLGFDEINKLNDNTAAVDAASNMNDLPIDVSSIWDDKVYSQANKKVDELTKGLKKKLKEFADNLRPLLQPARDALNELWNGGLKKAGEFTWGTLKDFYTEFLKPVGEWVLGSGLPRFLEITNDLLNGIDWDKLKGALKDFYKALANLTKLTFGVLLDFYEYFLKPVAQWTMNEALPRFLKITTDLINSVDWTKLKASLTELFKALAKLTQMTFTTLIDFYEKFLAPIAKWTLGEGIPRLAQATAKLVNDIDWNKLLESLSNLYSKLKDFTIDMVFTPLIDFYEDFLVPLATWTMGEALPKLADTLSDLFSGDWVDNLPGAIKSLKEFFGIELKKTSVWKDLAEALKEFWKGLEPLLEGAGTGVLSVLCKTLESFALVGKLLLQYLVAPTLKAIGKVLQSIPPSVFEVLAVAITTFVLSVKGLTVVGMFMKIFSMSNAMGIAHAITKFFGPILRVIYANPVSAAIALAMTAIYMVVKNWEAIKYVLKAIADGVVDFFTSIGKYFKEGFSLIGDFLLWLGKSILEGIAKGLGLDPEILKKAIKGIVDAICNFFCELLGIHSPSTVFAGFARNIIDGLIEGINAGIEVVKQAIGAIVDAITTPFKNAFNNVSEIIDAFANGGIVEGAKKIIEKLKSGLSNLVSIATAPFRLMVNTAINIIDKVIPGFKEKATNIVDGIKNGIKGGIEKVKNAIRDIVNAIKDTFCNLLGIHSPSTVFQGFAGNIIDGLINGLKAGIGKITSVVNQYLVKPVQDAVGTAMDSVLSDSTQVKIGNGLRRLMGESEADIKGIQIKKRVGVPKYASGGYPERGQMFIANETGAEMVGSLDGKTAVANQQEITNALVAALYPAIRDAFIDANQNSNTEVNVTLEGDANKMFRVMQQKGKAYQLATGNSVF